MEQVIDNFLGSVVKEIVVVVGHRAEGVIKSKDEHKKIIFDDRRGVVWVETKEDKGFAE